MSDQRVPTAPPPPTTVAVDTVAMATGRCQLQSGAAFVLRAPPALPAGRRRGGGAAAAYTTQGCCESRFRAAEIGEGETEHVAAAALLRGVADIGIGGRAGRSQKPSGVGPC